MIKYYITNPKDKGLTEIKSPQKNCWIHMESPAAEEIAFVSSVTGVQESFVRSALDEEEVAHIDIEGDERMIVVDIPTATEEKDSSEVFTIPLALIQNNDYLISVCTKPTTVINDFIHGKIKNVDTFLRSKLIYQIMYNNSTRFLYYLRRIDKASNLIQKNLEKSMQNKEIFQLLELQKSLVFFSASLTANYALVNKICNSTAKSGEEYSILEDLIIESKQALEMCSIYREIIKSTMDAFASIVNNNQNIVMKILTVITVILAIPTLIAGFWGMNTGVPFEGKLWGFWVAIGISMIVSVVVSIFMIKKKMF